MPAGIPDNQVRAIAQRAAAELSNAVAQLGVLEHMLEPALGRPLVAARAARNKAREGLEQVDQLLALVKGG